MKKLRKLYKYIICFAFVLIFSLIYVNGQEDNSKYILYPEPKSITYEAGTYILQDFNVRYGKSIDKYTVDRVKEVLKLKNLSENDNAKNILQVYTIEDDIDLNSYGITKQWFSEHLDSYFILSNNGNITIIGKNTDSAFYGATTLYHIFSQIDDLSIRNFKIEDFADIPTRGYIEGYYGNPWSVEDRIELMKWGGYYKLNAYIYAPKDDPKHNKQWRVLYTDDELKNIIEPQAKAGNESKNKFVYALHPYMYNPIKLGDTYEKDMNDLKAKFRQVIDYGVRQIAILADDAAFMGQDNYIKVLTDLTQWLKDEIIPIYKDMSLIIPFCTQEYMYGGEKYYSKFPENVQIIMTGGRVWGTVNQQFGNNFKRNTDRKVLYWINWPCSDNSKKHLIMGGYRDFLNIGVDKDNIDGIVLNPMQQSEPSKVAIFGNAVYSWKIWNSQEEADKAWEYSFNFVDHNNVNETVSSKALRELSKHMINQAMDGRVVALQESVEIRDLLASIRNDLLYDNVDNKKLEDAREIFEKLNDYAQTYIQHSGNNRIKDQIIFWLNSWKDITKAILKYLDAIDSIKKGNDTTTIQLSNEAGEYLSSSKKYGFHYVDHIEYAEVGVQHIVPFVNALSQYVNQHVKAIFDPNVIIQKFITSRTDNPIGSYESVFDGNDSTGISYRDSNQLYFPKDTYVGVQFNKVIDIKNIEFLLGTGKNHFENAKLQYSLNGNDWIDLQLKGMENEFIGIRNQFQRINILEENLPKNFKAQSIRLITTQDNKLDAWLDVFEIAINKMVAKNSDKIVEGTYSSNRNLMGGKNDYSVLKDYNDSSEVWLSNNSGDYKDKLQSDSEVRLTFNEPVYIKEVHFTQGSSNKNDILDEGVIEYLKDGKWNVIDNVGKVLKKTFDIRNKNIIAEAIRVRNIKDKGIWWRLGEFFAITGTPDEEIPIKYDVIKTDIWTSFQGATDFLHDGNDDSFIWYDPDGKGNKNNDNVMVGDFLGYNLGKIATIDKIHIVVGVGDSDKLEQYAIQYSVNGIDWENILGYENYQGVSKGKDIIDINLNGLKAQFLRIYNLKQKASWVKFAEFSIVEREKGNIKNSYYNTDTIIETINDIDNGIIKFANSDITLNSGQYVGFKLDNIDEILEIITPDELANIKVQIAKHPKLFEDIQSGSTPLDAKYIRFYSTVDNNTLDLSKIKVRYKVIKPLKISSNFDNTSDRDVRRKNNFSEIFDGNLGTGIVFTGVQEKGKEVLVDLGHEINMNSFRYYINENSKDFPRSMDISISDRVDGTFKKIGHIGSDEVINTYNENVAKSYQDLNYLLHDSSNPGNMYYEVDGLDENVRYIKFTVTESYSHRWFEIDEIVINKGKYISVEPHKDIVSSTIENKNHLPSHAIDADYDTYYELSDKGNFTYRISDENIKRVRIVQTGKPSYAKVSAIVLKNNDIKSIDLGILSQAINEFSLHDDEEFVEIIVAFEEKVGNIVDISLSTEALQETDRSKLDEIVKTIQPYDTWTQSSKVLYDEAIKNAKDVLVNPYITQQGIDSALAHLKYAISKAVVKGNVDAVENDVNNALSMVDDDVVIYELRSFKIYEELINKAKEILNNDKDNITVEVADNLHKEIIKAKDSLVYSNIEKQKAKIFVEKFTFDSNNYTQLSYSNYLDVKNELVSMLDSDVTPIDIRKKVIELENIQNKLVYIKELKDIISRDIIPSDYTYESYKEYKNIIDNEVTEILKSGSKESVTKLIEKLSNLLVPFDYNKEISNLEISISEKLYTKDSYKRFKNKLNDIKNKINNISTKNEAIEELKNIRNILVNIESLLVIEQNISNIDFSIYAKQSRDIINELNNNLLKLKDSGSEHEIKDFINNFNKVIDSLIFNAKDKAKEVEDEKLIKEESKYREAAYKSYLNVYNRYKNAVLEDISIYDYNKLLQNLLIAKSELKEKFKLLNNGIDVVVDDNDYYDGKVITISEITDIAVIEKFKNIFNNFNFRVYDINLLSGDEKIQPKEDEPIRIRIKLDDFMLNDNVKIKLLHLYGDIIEEIEKFVIEDGYLVFEANKFSNYAIGYKKLQNEKQEIKESRLDTNNNSKNILATTGYGVNFYYYFICILCTVVIIVVLKCKFIKK